MKATYDLDDSFFENPLVKAHESNILPMLKGITLKRTFLFTSQKSLEVIRVILNSAARNELESSLKKLLDGLSQDSVQYLESKYTFNSTDDVLLQNQLKQFEDEFYNVRVQIEELEIELNVYLEQNDFPIEIKKAFQNLINER